MVAVAAKTTAGRDRLSDFVGSLINRWRDDHSPDTERVLREHPDLLNHRSLVVDLLYEEYCLLEETGQVPNTEEFCRKVPAFRSQVREVIHGHRILAEVPEFKPASAMRWPHDGERFEGLVILRELGRGAFARAYLASDPEAGNRQVVLKVSPRQSGEARTLGPISHPHIAGVLWARRTENYSILCLPYLGSATLRDVLDAMPPDRRTTLSLLQETGVLPGDHPLLTGREQYSTAVARLAECLASALEYLHKSGITHGDIKPSNIVLGPGAVPCLIDFNLASDSREDRFRLSGTLPYMAPELLEQLFADSGVAPFTRSAADVFALGAVMFEALTGRLPFDAREGLTPRESARFLLESHRSTRPLLDSGIPRSLAVLVESCLAFDPARRPTAEQVHRGLVEFLRPAHHWRTLAILGTGFAVAVCGVFLGTSGMRDKQTVTTVPVAVSPPSTAEEFLARGKQSLRSGDYAAANKEFGEAYRRAQSGESCAYLAFALGQSGNHREASKFYKLACETHAYSSAWAHNNRAYSLLQAEPTVKNAQLALEACNTALTLDPNLIAAKYNRAVARYVVSFDPKTQSISDPECVADIEAVVGSTLPNPVLYFDAALYTTALGKGRPEATAKASEYLIQAIRLGRPSEKIFKDPVFKKYLVPFVDIKKIESTSQDFNSQSAKNLRIVDPTHP